MTVSDLRKLREEMKDKPYLSRLDWIAPGAFVDRGSLTTPRCSPGLYPLNRLRAMTLTDGLRAPSCP